MGNGLLFRCDFGGTRGWGHVVRCSSLAFAAKAKGLPTGLVTQAQMEDLPEEVGKAFDKVFPVNNAIPAQNVWKRLINPDSEWGCVVIDQYDYARRELTLLRQVLDPGGASLVVIDDEATRELSSVDLVVNHILGADPTLYPRVGEVCAGVSYAMIRPGFESPGEPVPELDELKNPVVIMYGGTDPRNLSGATVRYLFEILGDTIEPVLIRNRKVAFHEEIEKELRRFSKYVWLEHASSEELAHCFRTAKFAITACGGSVYEIAFCQLPFIGVIVAENQQRLAKNIESDWRMPVVSAEKLNRRILSTAVDSLKKRLTEIKRTKATNFAEIDARGPDRVIASIQQVMR